MQVLQSLGVNSTLWIQILIFFIAFLILNNLVFRPYLKAFEKRGEQTLGQANLAEEIDLRTQDLHMQYEASLRRQNQEVQKIFNDLKKDGAQEAGQLLDQARVQMENITANTRQKVNEDVSRAKDEFKTQIPEISKAIVEKLVGRNI